MGTIASALDDIMRASRARNDHKEKKEDTRGRNEGMAKISALLPVHREVTREGDSKGRGRHAVKVARREGAVGWMTTNAN